MSWLPGTAFGCDWPPSYDPHITDHILDPLSGFGILFDLSALPVNSCAIVRFSWIAIKAGPSGAVQVASNGTLVAFRNSAGDLVADVNAYTADLLTLPSGVLTVNGVGVIDQSAFIDVQNGDFETRLRVISMVSFVASPVPIEPFVGP